MNKKMELSEDNYEKPVLSIIEDKNKKSSEKKDENKKEEKDEKQKEENEKNSKKDKNQDAINLGKGVMYGCSAVSFSTSIPRFFLAAGGIGLLAVSSVFTIIGSAIGFGVGYYLMKRHCDDLLDQFELLFIQNADRVSNSLVFGINYLKNMAEFYKKQGC